MNKLASTFDEEADRLVATAHVTVVEAPMPPHAPEVPAAAPTTFCSPVQHTQAPAMAPEASAAPQGPQMAFQSAAGPEEAPSQYASPVVPDIVVIKGSGLEINDIGTKLGKLLARAGYFIEDSELLRFERDPRGRASFKTITSSELPGVFSSVTKLWQKSPKGDLTEAIMPEPMARNVRDSVGFGKAIPHLVQRLKYPVLTRKGGKLTPIHGYDQETGIFALGDLPEEVGLEEAKRLLLEAAKDFDFATEGSRSRFFASIFTQPICEGDLIGRERCPAQLYEADISQAGKGYASQLAAAINGTPIRTIVQRAGNHLGGLEGSFATAIYDGYTLVRFDNLRGKVDSPLLESFIREPDFGARIPYDREKTVDPRHTIVHLTSNKAEFSPDLSKRTSCISIKARPQGYEFHNYGTDNDPVDILGHVLDHPGRYKGAVWAVLREWERLGFPRTQESRHEFRGWVRAVDAICQRILGLAPVMDGHREIQNRLAGGANPDWFKELIRATVNAGMVFKWIRASDLVFAVTVNHIETPGVTGETDKAKANQAMGLLLKNWLGREPELTRESNGFIVKRKPGEKDPKGNIPKLYWFEPIANKPGSLMGGAL